MSTRNNLYAYMRIFQTCIELAAYLMQSCSISYFCACVCMCGLSVVYDETQLSKPFSAFILLSQNVLMFFAVFLCKRNNIYNNFLIQGYQLYTLIRFNNLTYYFCTSSKIVTTFFVSAKLAGYFRLATVLAIFLVFPAVLFR